MCEVRVLCLREENKYKRLNSALVLPYTSSIHQVCTLRASEIVATVGHGDRDVCGVALNVESECIHIGRTAFICHNTLFSVSYQH